MIFLAAVTLAMPFPGCKGGTLAGCPGTPNCTVHWLEQKIDHFNWAPPLGDEKHTTFKQRFFVNDQWWDRKNDGPVFFYFGNEDNVELYVNHTGLMWESAAAFGALLVFGEHRYYGMSLPFEDGQSPAGCMDFLTTEQAMADFAYLIDHLRVGWGAADSAMIGFGGSYGGMLGAWFRVHYPNAVDGVISASAPIWSFVGLDPPYNYNAFNLGVTYDASKAGGSTDACKDNLKQAWPRILLAGQTQTGRETLARAFRTCSPLRPKHTDPKSGATVDDAYSIMRWADSVWGTMAMGNYPYASSYLLHGDSMLPAWPVRTACAHLAHVDAQRDGDEALFGAVRAAAATLHNNTGDKQCFNITSQPPMSSSLGASSRLRMTSSLEIGPRGHLSASASAAPRANSCRGSWGYQWCTEMTQPFTQGTEDDMFWCPNGTFYPKQNCSAWPTPGPCSEWGVTPRPEWARVSLGGKRILGASNIVFSNGLLDPWHGGGVLRNLSDSLLAVVIPNGAHHIDLMFSDPADEQYTDIRWAREFERTQIRRWVDEHRLIRQGAAPARRMAAAGQERCGA
jgi:lysosomal Pro-X carboxypeptidase